MAIAIVLARDNPLLLLLRKGPARLSQGRFSGPTKPRRFSMHCQPLHLDLAVLAEFAFVGVQRRIRMFPPLLVLVSTIGNVLSLFSACSCARVSEEEKEGDNHADEAQGA